VRESHETARREGVAAALAAAALFGVGTPLAKLLLPGTGAMMLAALLYGGAGLGLVAIGVVRRMLGWGRREAPLRRGDLPLLAGVVLTGGVVAPVLLLLGLERLPAADASLLLNLEAPITVLLAVALFGEHVGGRVLIGTALIVAGAATLGGGTAPGDRWTGMALVAAACLGWAVDNNLTQRLSLRDPIAIARVKALAAGAINMMLALAAGHALPAASQLAGPLAVGTVSYGLSIALAVRAMSLLGAARQAALFAVAPFVGAVASAFLVGDRVDLPAGLVMAAGVALLVREWHEHVHVHEPLEHDHLHVHDEHHQHEHDGAGGANEPHAHPHRHVPLTHAHPHVSDVHHRHAHGWRWWRSAPR
jgi:drug/metabolite transporter (DMT)-like permease